MLTIPNDTKKARLITNELKIILNSLPAFCEWLETQLDNIDIENRVEENTVIMRHKQGASQVIEKLLHLIGKSKEEAIRLNSIRSEEEKRK